jgi:hypothetical protein
MRPQEMHDFLKKRYGRRTVLKGAGIAAAAVAAGPIHQPYNREGQRTGALRFGDPCAMTLAGALCCVVHAATSATTTACTR